MKRYLTAVCLMLAGLCVYGGRLDPRLVAGDAVWVAHLDLEKINEAGGAMCAWLVEQSYKPEAAKKLTYAHATLGIDLRTALRGITIYGMSGDETQGAALLEGAFEKEKLLSVIANADNYGVSTNDGCEVHSWTKKDNPVEHQYAAIHGTNIVAFASDETTLVHVLKVLQGRSAGGADATLLKIAGEDNIFTAAFQSDEPLKWPQAGMLKNADAGVLSLKESDGQVSVRLMLNVTDKAQAENLHNVAQGLKAMAQLNAGDKPEAAKLAENIVVDRHEQAVSLTLSAPSGDIVKMFEEAEAKKNAARRERRQEKNRPEFK